MDDRVGYYVTYYFTLITSINSYHALPNSIILFILGKRSLTKVSIDDPHLELAKLVEMTMLNARLKLDANTFIDVILTRLYSLQQG